MLFFLFALNSKKQQIFNINGALQFVGGNSEKLQSMMSSTFDHIMNKLEVALLVRTASSIGGSGGAGNGGGGASGAAASAPAQQAAAGVITGADVVGALAMLSVLTEFETSYREAMIIQFSNNIMANNNNNNTASGSLAPPPSPPRKGRYSVQTPGADDVPIPSARSDEEALTLYLELYLTRCMESQRLNLLSRISAFTSDQINWLKVQKADPKTPDVLPPFASFPTLVAQVQEMCNGKVTKHDFCLLHVSFVVS